MKTPQDFMPPMPRKWNTSTGHVVDWDEFEHWYETHIKPLFENGVVMKGYISKGNWDGQPSMFLRPDLKDPNGRCTHVGLLIGIQPINQAVTKEELLRVLITEAAMETDKDREKFFRSLVDRIEKWGVR